MFAAGGRRPQTNHLRTRLAEVEATVHVQFESAVHGYVGPDQRRFTDQRPVLDQLVLIQLPRHARTLPITRTETTGAHDTFLTGTRMRLSITNHPVTHTLPAVAFRDPASAVARTPRPSRYSQPIRKSD